MALSDVIELVEITQDTLDVVWKQSDPPFAEARMRHLLDVIGQYEMFIYNFFKEFLINIY